MCSLGTHFKLPHGSLLMPRDTQKHLSTFSKGLVLNFSLSALSQLCLTTVGMLYFRIHALEVSS